MSLFSTLTVSLQGEILHLQMGVGVIRKKILLRDIVSSQVVKNPWYYGWGIHLTPHGWLYNVSGFWAVEITLSSGKKYRIGTDEPEVLHEVISQHTRT